jgi:hypothetical protein
MHRTRTADPAQARRSPLMAKIIGILLIVVGVWVGLTIFNEGTDAAFGGLLAGSKKGAADGSGGPVPRRIQKNVGQAYEAHEERTVKNTEE